MRFQLLTTLLLLAFLGLFMLAGGCSKVPVTSMMKLARIDFETTDLSALRAAILLPASLRPSPGTGRLTVVLEQSDGSTEKHTFKLREIEDPEAAMLNEEAESAGRIYAYTLSSRAVRTFEQLRREALAARGNGRGGSKMTLSIAADACHVADPQQGRLAITTYLKTKETRSFVPLVRNFDLRTLSRGKPLDLRPCPR